MAKWSNPLRDTKPMTIGIFLLTALWAVFQWKDPSPPPVLDQILVAAFGIWFANEAIDKKNGKGRRSVKIGKDGSVSMSSDDDEDDEETDDEEADDKAEDTG